MKPSRGRGRRAGQADTKELIRKAARGRFLSDGYANTSMRSIAAAAGVDVALVSYYFGSKRGLFTAAMSLKINPAEIVETALQGDLETLPTRMLRAMLAVWDDTESGAPLLALMRAAANEPAVGRLAAEVVERDIVMPIADAIGGEEALARAATVCAQMSGILLSRYLLRIEPIASMTVEEITSAFEPALARVLSPP